MAKFGEWSEKGASLAHGTAEKEYGVDYDFIVTGIKAGRLEYQEVSIYGNPALKVLRRQLEKYIDQVLGKEYLQKRKKETELRSIKRELNSLKKRMSELQARKKELEKLS